MSRLLRFLPVLALLGCGPTGPVRVAVSGTVTFIGRPLEVGTIEFHPVDPTAGEPGGAEVSAGAYTIPASRGLRPGRYVVQVSSAVAPGPADGTAPGAIRLARERIPGRYNAASELTAEVTERGTNRFDFTLTD